MIKPRGHVPNALPLCAGCSVATQLKEVVEAVAAEVLEAQADMQMPMGILRFHDLMHVGPTDYPVDEGLTKALARLHRLLGVLGHPMYNPQQHDDLGELPKVLRADA